MASKARIGLRGTPRVLNFGMVNIGIKLAPALNTSARIAGKLRDPDTLGPVKKVYVNEAGEIVEPVKAFPRGDEFVVVDTADIKAESDSTIKLVANICVSDLPWELVESTNLAFPDGDAAEGAYAMMADYLHRNARVFIGTTVSNGTTKVFALRWSVFYGAVVAHQVSYHERVRWASVEAVQSGVEAIPAVEKAMADMADAAFAAVATDFDWESVHDTYGAALAALVETGTADAPAAAEKQADDLMAALAASVKAAPTKKKVKA